MYKRRNMYKIFKNKIVVLDIDGTLTEFRHHDKRLLPVADADFDDYCADNDAYHNVRPLKTLQRIVKKLRSDDLYILSTSPKLPRQEQKIKWLQKHYPNIKRQNIYFVKEDKAKYEVLATLKNKYPDRTICFIDDTTKTLLHVEELDEEFELYHITSFIR